MHEKRKLLSIIQSIKRFFTRKKNITEKKNNIQSVTGESR